MAIGTLFLSSQCFANSAECILVEENTSLGLTINSDNNFFNCFSLEAIPQNTSLAGIVISADSVRSNIRLFDFNQLGDNSLIAQFSSDASGGIAINTNTMERKLGFKIDPTSHLESDKNLQVGLLTLEGGYYLTIILEDIPVAGNQDKLGTCTIRNGVEFCRETF